MTIICALTDGTDTWLGSDRRTTYNHKREYVDDEPKWHERCGWWIGCAGTTRTGVLLDMLEDAPAHSAQELADWLLDAIVADKWTPNEDRGGPRTYDVGFLLARPGEVWLVMDSLRATRIPAGRLAAEGSGMYFAAGAAWALLQSGALHEIGYLNAVDIALRAAIAHDPGCGGEPWATKI